MPTGKGYGALPTSSGSARKSLIKSSTKTAISRGILELGASLRTADTMRANKKKFQGGVAQSLFNKMGAKLYGSSIKAQYKKSGFNQPTGQQLVANFNKAQKTAALMEKNASKFQPASGQSRVATYLGNSPINSMNKKNLTSKGSQTPKPSTGKITSHSTKAGDLEAFYARTRAIHKARGIKVKNKSQYRAYQGY